MQLELQEHPIQEKSLHWDKVRNITISPEVGENRLIPITQSARLKVHPAYYHAGIIGALEAVYTRPAIVLKLQKLLTLLPDEIGILVLDAWRPYAVQVALRNNFKSQLIAKNSEASAQEIEEILNQFVAMPSQNPLYPSPHLTGGSIDLTLFNIASGDALDMGTAFDEMDERSWSHAFENMTHKNATPHDLTIRNNRRLLINGMKKVGFSNLPSEWWHFDYGNQLWGYYHHCDAIYGVASL